MTHDETPGTNGTSAAASSSAGEVDLLRETVQALEQELARVRAEAASQSDLVQVTRRQLDAAREDRNSVWMLATSLQQSCGSLQRELAGMRDQMTDAHENTDLRRHAANLEADRTALREHASNLERDRESLREHSANLEHALAALRQHAANVEADREAIRAGWSSNEAQLRQHIINLERELAALREHVHNVEADREAIRAHADATAQHARNLQREQWGQPPQR